MNSTWNQDAMAHFPSSYLPPQNAARLTIILTFNFSYQQRLEKDTLGLFN
jgi:hypothetical protein